MKKNRKVNRIRQKNIKLYLLFSVFAFAIIASMILGIKKIDGIYYWISNMKSSVSNSKWYTYRNQEKNIDFAQYDRLEPEGNQWYEEYHIVAHSGGGY